MTGNGWQPLHTESFWQQRCKAIQGWFRIRNGWLVHCTWQPCMYAAGSEVAQGLIDARPTAIQGGDRKGQLPRPGIERIERNMRRYALEGATEAVGEEQERWLGEFKGVGKVSQLRGADNVGRLCRRRSSRSSRTHIPLQQAMDRIIRHRPSGPYRLFQAPTYWAWDGGQRHSPHPLQSAVAAAPSKHARGARPTATPVSTTDAAIRALRVSTSSSESFLSSLQRETKPSQRIKDMRSCRQVRGERIPAIDRLASI
jgi:hypothetical protein